MFKKSLLFVVACFVVLLVSASEELGKPIKIMASNYENQTAKGFVLVEFWAPWCAPCRKLTPVLNAIAADQSLVVKVGKMNIDDNRTFAIRMGIKTIPTMILYNEGKEVTRLSGLYSKEELVEIITNAQK